MPDARWCGLDGLSPDELSPPVRERLAERWAQAALGEHASIGSFARFSLHLLAVGAPPELLAETQQAALDEVRHAETAFALASAYAGEPLGPGPLPLDGDILGPTDLGSIVAAAVAEGCLGETRASMEAARAAELASAPPVAEALRLIAGDEMRHAALAWKFVRWAIESGGDPVRDVVREVFATYHSTTGELPPAEEHEALLLAHGLLTPRERHGVRLQFERDVLPQASAALLRG